MLLLDTHVWIWAIEPSSRLGRKAGRLIEQAASREQLRVSEVSVFEVSMLNAMGWLRVAVHHLAAVDASR